MKPVRRRIPLDTLRTAIADTLWNTVSANDLPAVCTRLGLRHGEVDEAFRSKRAYVRRRLAEFSEDVLLKVADAVTAEYEAPDLDDYLSQLTSDAQHRISDLTRRAALTALDDIGPLFGDTDVFEGLASLRPNWDQRSEFGGFLATLRDDVQRHYLDNEDYSNSRLLELCGALTCSQRRFFDVLERILDPVCRQGKEQQAVADRLDKLFRVDGFAVTVGGELSGHQVYEIAQLHGGVAGTPKNLIFAAIRAKPDLYLTDAINNDVAIRNESDALVYYRPLSDTGLTWSMLVDWWQDREQANGVDEARKQLYRRLLEAVKAANSPGEYALFDSYYREFAPRLGDRLPALVPQVYLHYDPRTQSNRGGERVLVRQRMDLLLLLEHRARIVLEVDGRHHYADGDVASAKKYAEMTEEDRRLRLSGYEVYRFGAAEFGDVRVNGTRITVGPESRAVAVKFFERLLSRHSVLSR